MTVTPEVPRPVSPASSRAPAPIDLSDYDGIWEDREMQLELKATYSGGDSIEIEICGRHNTVLKETVRPDAGNSAQFDHRTFSGDLGMAGITFEKDTIAVISSYHSGAYRIETEQYEFTRRAW